MNKVSLSHIDTSSPATVGAGFNFPFAAPVAFANLVGAIQSLSSDPDELFDGVLGLFPRGFDGRYQSTPIEFFPLGSTGMDGEHIGFVNLAPELKQDDFPLAFITPMASEGVFCIGATAKAGLERLMSFHLRRVESDQETECAGKIRDVAKAAGLLLDPAGFGKTGPFSAGPALLDGDGVPMRIPVDVPEGYHFEKSTDGVGVLAPQAVFKPGIDTSSLEALDFSAMDKMYESGIQELIDNGYFGTALLVLKHFHYEDGLDNWELYSSCYEALGRTELAEVARRYEEI